MKNKFKFLFIFGLLSSNEVYAQNGLSFPGANLLTADKDKVTSDALLIPCLDDSGAVKNSDSADVCKSILPSCSALRNKMIDLAKDQLEWKIYGYYYLGKDLDLSESTPEAPVGDTLAVPLCSVVGHKLKASQIPGDLELERQSIGLKASCGQTPLIENRRLRFKTELVYKGDAGKQWFAYLKGAYPWVIRANAYDVFNSLKTDLSNLSQVVQTSAMTDDMKALVAAMKSDVRALSGAAKTSCQQTQSIVEDCKNPDALGITAPVQKVCTLAKAQLAINEVSIPNILVHEIMRRSEQMYNEKFGNMLAVDDAGKPLNKNFQMLSDHCSKKTSRLDGAGGMMAMSAGALAGATLVSGSIAIAGSAGAAVAYAGGAAPFAAGIFGPAAIVAVSTKALASAALARNTYSCNASCLMGGAEYYTGKKEQNDDNDKIWPSVVYTEGNKFRKCEAKVGFKLMNYTNSQDAVPFNEQLKFSIRSFPFKVKVSVKKIVDEVESWVDEEHDRTSDARDILERILFPNSTFTYGFRGAIEAIIRLDVCQQYGGKDKDNKCDQVNIGNVPKAKR